MMIFDFDNYDGALTREDIVHCLMAGMQGAIVGLQYPGPQYPPGVAHQQLVALIEAGVPIEGVYAQSQHIASTWNKVAHLRAFIPRIWTAVEEPHVDRQWINEHLDFADHLGLAQPGGIYTGSWFWNNQEYAGEYGNRHLWAAEYGSAPDAEAFTPFGAWGFCVLKQWNGAAQVGRLSVDLNVDRRWR